MFRALQTNCGALLPRWHQLTSINQVPETSSHYADPKAIVLTGVFWKQPHSAKHESIHERVRYRQRFALCQTDSSSRMTSSSSALSERPWRIRKNSGILKAAFIIFIIVLNLEDDQWEELRVSIPTAPCCCAEMITVPGNALLNVRHTRLSFRRQTTNRITVHSSLVLHRKQKIYI